MAQHRCLRAIALFLGMVLAFIFVPGLHADQSMDEAIAILTTGDGTSAARPHGHMEGVSSRWHLRIGKSDKRHMEDNPERIGYQLGTGFFDFHCPLIQTERRDSMAKEGATPRP